MGRNSPGYFKKWYEDKKEEISARRRERYKSDPEYRARVLEATAKYRAGNRKEKAIVTKRRRKPRREKVKGGEILLYSVGFLATYIGRSVQTLSYWQRDGGIPETPYRYQMKRGSLRYYTMGMMDVIRNELGDDYYRVKLPDNFCEIIENKWIEIGVPVGASTLEEALEKTVFVKE